MTQTEQIREHLHTHGAIDQMVALQQYGCMRLGARIYDLRRTGHPIETRTVRRNGKSYARYVLAEEAGA